MTFFHRCLTSQRCTRFTRVDRLSGSDFITWSNSANWNGKQDRQTGRGNSRQHPSSLSPSLHPSSHLLPPFNPPPLPPSLNLPPPFPSTHAHTFPALKNTLDMPKQKSLSSIPTALNRARLKVRGSSLANLAGRTSLYLGRGGGEG